MASNARSLARSRPIDLRALHRAVGRHDVDPVASAHETVAREHLTAVPDADPGTGAGCPTCPTTPHRDDGGRNAAAMVAIAFGTRAR